MENRYDKEQDGTMGGRKTFPKATSKREMKDEAFGNSRLYALPFMNEARFKSKG